MHFWIFHWLELVWIDTLLKKMKMIVILFHALNIYVKTQTQNQIYKYSVSNILQWLIRDSTGYVSSFPFSRGRGKLSSAYSIWGIKHWYFSVHNFLLHEKDSKALHRVAQKPHGTPTEWVIFTGRKHTGPAQPASVQELLLPGLTPCSGTHSRHHSMGKKGSGPVPDFSNYIQWV